MYTHSHEFFAASDVWLQRAVEAEEVGAKDCAAVRFKLAEDYAKTAVLLSDAEKELAAAMNVWRRTFGGVDHDH